jgi:hypothetical protein
MPKSVPNGLSFLFNGGVNGWVPEGVDWTKIKFEGLFEPKHIVEGPKMNFPQERKTI